MVYEVLIIGSGPAGLTAAIYTTRGAAKTVVLAGTSWGGQLMLTTEVENFPGFESIQGPELMEKIKSHALKFGTELVLKDVQNVNFHISPFEVTSEGQEYQAKTVIIATGARTRWMGLSSEQRLIGRGVSSCAPCDAPFFKDKNVIVVGGGDSAMEESLVLAKYASHVRIVHRRDSFRASKIMQDRVLNNPKIDVTWDSTIEEIIGEDRVSGVQLKNVKTEQITRMPIDGIFVAIGHDPETEVFKGQLELDEKGYIKKVHKEGVGAYKMMTSVEGVFVAGDVHDYHYRQAITAAGFGCMAAMEALNWLDTRG